MSENNKQSEGSAHDDSSRDAVLDESLQPDPDGRSGESEDQQAGTGEKSGVNDAPEQRHEGEAEGFDRAVDETPEPAHADSASEELGRLRDALLRTRAEMDNLHKRAERELEKSRKFAVESLLKDFVPVIDSLDQGIEAGSDNAIEGLTLTRKLALDTLKRYGLEVLDPADESFDPQWHEAMSMIESEDHASGQVISVLQKGYRLHDRVVRPARVVVAK